MLSSLTSRLTNTPADLVSIRDYCLREIAALPKHITQLRPSGCYLALPGFPPKTDFPVCGRHAGSVSIHASGILTCMVAYSVINPVFLEPEMDEWIENSDVVTMFPTFVWKTQLIKEFHESLNTKILRVLENKRRDNSPLAPGEGWQSDQALHQLEELHELTRCIRTATRSVLTFLKTGYDAFEITGCWASIYAVGASHRMHSHPNNYLSGVYYVKTQPGAETINFHDPRNQTGIIRPPVSELTAGNTDQVVVRVQNGTLLLFPAWLQHSVDPNQSDKLRISISFNSMFSGFTEQLSKPLW